MNEVLENIIPWMEVIEGAIYSDKRCPTSFEKRFCEGNQMTGVWFSSTEIKVNFVISSGTIVTNTYPMSDLNDWLETEDE